MREDLPRLGLSTRWSAARRRDLEAVVDDMAALGVGLIEVALPEDGVDVAGFNRGMNRHRARCHGVALETPEVERFLVPHLLQNDTELRERAWKHLRRGVKTAAAIRTTRVATALGTIAVEFEEQRLADLEEALKSGDDGARMELLGALLRSRERKREAACETLCRALFALDKEEPGLEIVILPKADPLAFPNLEECGWILDDLQSFCSLRLDLAELGLREALGLERLEDWIARFEGRADATYHADFHGFKTDLPPGAGLLGERLWKLGLSPRLPTILKLDPASSRLTVEEALRRLR